MQGSAHYDGRAIDIFVRPISPENKEKGWAIAQYLVAMADRLDIRTVIFDDRIWTAGSALRRRLARLRPAGPPGRPQDPRAPRPRPRRRVRLGPAAWLLRPRRRRADGDLVPRASEQIDDRTPLSAARIDVAARVGWLLRTHRTVAGLSLRQMSSALGEHGVTLSAARLSRIESEGQRFRSVLDGYARVLGLPEGAIRADIDILCRAFSYAPPALAESTVRSLMAFDRGYESIDVPQPSGGDWLAFARQHALDRGFGLPTRLMEPHGAPPHARGRPRGRAGPVAPARGPQPVCSRAPTPSSSRQCSVRRPTSRATRTSTT